MTEFNILQVFERYGVDTVLVAFLVVFGVWLLKKTLLKNHLHNVAVAFLPFGLGVIVFALVQCILHFSFVYLWENLADIVQCGCTAGGLSTLLSAALSRFSGKKALSQKASVVRELIIELVKEEELDELSVQIANCVSSDYSDADAAKVVETLQDRLRGNATESEVQALARLIVQTLKTTAV